MLWKYVHKNWTQWFFVFIPTIISTTIPNDYYLSYKCTSYKISSNRKHLLLPRLYRVIGITLNGDHFLTCLLQCMMPMSAVSNGTIYCTGTCLEKCNEHEVYCSMKSNEWEKLPRSGHRLGVIHIVDGKLTIFGGRDSATNDIHKKVTTYNSKENSWGSCYPDMLHNRYKPGVITSHDHVIVMGGASSPDTDLDSIEAMNYRDEVPQWKEVSLHLPFPMWNIKPTVSDDNITIVGYSDDVGRDKGYFQIPVEQKISSLGASCYEMEEDVIACTF